MVGVIKTFVWIFLGTLMATGALSFGFENTGYAENDERYFQTQSKGLFDNAYGMVKPYASQNFSENNEGITLKDRELCKEQRAGVCPADYSFAGKYEEWRFIPNIGWRKFSGFGGARLDWWDYKRFIRNRRVEDFFRYYGGYPFFGETEPRHYKRRRYLP